MDHRSIKKAVKGSVSDSILINSLGGFFDFIDDSVYDSVLYTVVDSVEVSVNETSWGGLASCITNRAREILNNPT